MIDKMGFAKNNGVNHYLNSQLAELNYLYRSLPVGLGFLDTDLRYIRLNDTLSQINKVSIEDHIGKTVDQVLPKKLSSEIIAILVKVRDTREPSLNIEFKSSLLSDSDHLQKWNVCYHPVESTEGELLGIGIFVQDMTDIKNIKQKLKNLNLELNEVHANLQDKNIAMRELMYQIDEGKNEIAQNIQINIDKSIMPMMARLSQQLSLKEKEYLSDIQQELSKLTSPYINLLVSKFSNLSHRDIGICKQIMNGKSTKEIADFLNVSEEAIRSRRKIIRKKLGIDGKKISLVLFLRSLK